MEVPRPLTVFISAARQVAGAGRPAQVSRMTGIAGKAIRYSELTRGRRCATTHPTLISSGTHADLRVRPLLFLNRIRDTGKS